MMSEELAMYKYAVFMEISGHRMSLDIYIKNILKVTQLEKNNNIGPFKNI